MGIWHNTMLLALVACGEPLVPAPPAGQRLPEVSIASLSSPFDPIPAHLDLDVRQVELGGRLFREPKLSGGGDRACVSCHEIESGGVVPGERLSNHPLNATGPYNVPTVLNVGFNFRLNWNGKFLTLEEHLQGPMMSKEVMNAGSWAELTARLRPAYDAMFRAAGYESGVTEEAVRSALATYQRSLITPNSRFDRSLRGEINLSDDELDGYELFKSIGCASCHQGINVGGNLFQRYGVIADAFRGRPAQPSDYGRKLVTGRDEDAFVFRVPSLRNVALTAPYFHDGSAPTLEAAIDHMAQVQLGYELTKNEVRVIAAFLRTLTGELNGRPLAPTDGP